MDSVIIRHEANLRPVTSRDLILVDGPQDRSTHDTEVATLDCCLRHIESKDEGWRHGRPVHVVSACQEVNTSVLQLSPFFEVIPHSSLEWTVVVVVNGVEAGAEVAYPPGSSIRESDERVDVYSALVASGNWVLAKRHCRQRFPVLKEI